MMMKRKRRSPSENYRKADQSSNSDNSDSDDAELLVDAIFRCRTDELREAALSNKRNKDRKERLRKTMRPSKNSFRSETLDYVDNDAKANPSRHSRKSVVQADFSNQARNRVYKHYSDIDNVHRSCRSFGRDSYDAGKAQNSTWNRPVVSDRRYSTEARRQIETRSTSSNEERFSSDARYEYQDFRDESPGGKMSYRAKLKSCIVDDSNHFLCMNSRLASQGVRIDDEAARTPHKNPKKAKKSEKKKKRKRHSIADDEIQSATMRIFEHVQKEVDIHPEVCQKVVSPSSVEEKNSSENNSVVSSSDLVSRNSGSCQQTQNVEEIDSFSMTSTRERIKTLFRPVKVEPSDIEKPIKKIEINVDSLKDREFIGKKSNSPGTTAENDSSINHSNFRVSNKNLALSRIILAKNPAVKPMTINKTVHTAINTPDSSQTNTNGTDEETSEDEVVYYGCANKLGELIEVADTQCAKDQTSMHFSTYICDSPIRYYWHQSKEFMNAGLTEDIVIELDQLFADGLLTDELSQDTIVDLATLDEDLALAVVNMFRESDLTKVRNKSVFFKGKVKLALMKGDQLLKIPRDPKAKAQRPTVDKQKGDKYECGGPVIEATGCAPRANSPRPVESQRNDKDVFEVPISQTKALLVTEKGETENEGNASDVNSSPDTNCNHNVPTCVNSSPPGQEAQSDPHAHSGLESGNVEMTEAEVEAQLIEIETECREYEAHAETTEDLNVSSDNSQADSAHNEHKSNSFAQDDFSSDYVLKDVIHEPAPLKQLPLKTGGFTDTGSPSKGVDLQSLPPSNLRIENSVLSTNAKFIAKCAAPVQFKRVKCHAAISCNQLIDDKAATRFNSEVALLNQIIYCGAGPSNYVPHQAGQYSAVKLFPDYNKLDVIVNLTQYHYDDSDQFVRCFGPPRDWQGDVPHQDCKLFVGKLPCDVFEDDLIPVFFEAGNIYELRLLLDPETRLNQGFCFVTMCTKTEADKAIRLLHGRFIRSRHKMIVKREIKFNQLFVMNVPKNKTADQILEAFSDSFRGVVSVHFESTENGPANPGFCILTFESYQTAKAARERGTNTMAKRPPLRAFNNYDYYVLDWAIPDDVIHDVKPRGCTTILVKNLKPGTTEEQLRDHFATYGTIERVTQREYHAFITFTDSQSALTAIKGLAIGGGLDVKLSEADPGEAEKVMENKLYGSTHDNRTRVMNILRAPTAQPLCPPRVMMQRNCAGGVNSSQVLALAQLAENNPPFMRGQRMGSPSQSHSNRPPFVPPPQRLPCPAQRILTHRFAHLGQPIQPVPPFRISRPPIPRWGDLQ